MTQKAKAPAIRFKGFADAWEQRKLGEIVKTELKGKAKAEMSGSDSVYLDANYLNGGEKFYVDSPSDVEEDDVLILWDGSQAGTVYHGFKGALGSTLKAYKPKYSGGFIYQQLKNNQQLIYNSYRTPNIPHVVKTFTDEFTVYVPNIEEQLKISCLLSNLDNLITLHQRKLLKLKNIKKAMLEKMFPKNGSTVPEIRFDGFTDAWEQRKLGELMEITSVKRIHQSDWTKSGVRFLRARDIVSAYKGEEPADYLYISQQKYDEFSNLSGKVKIGDLLVTGVGSIGIPMLVRTEKPLYFKDGNVIWFRNESIDGDFFYYSFTANSIQKYIRDVAGIGTVGTYTIDSGKKTPIYNPSYDEQVKVGQLFTNLDYLITLHQRKLEKLQNLKKACLEKMFV
jgi:type I restriction enzyme S subunit